MKNLSNKEIYELGIDSGYIRELSFDEWIEYNIKQNGNFTGGFS